MRQSDVITPHFAQPFQFGGINGGALTNEQDTSDDVATCVKNIIIYPLGFRDDFPDFGVPEMVFRMITTAPIIDRIGGILADLEPRAHSLNREDLSEIENFTRHFVIQLRNQDV